MKAKLLVMALLLTAAALVSEPPARASILCPPINCFDAIQACVNSGGAPIPEDPNETCYTLPTHDTHDINIIHCYYPATNTYEFEECYQ